MLALIELKTRTNNEIALIGFCAKRVLWAIYGVWSRQKGRKIFLLISEVVDD